MAERYSILSLLTWLAALIVIMTGCLSNGNKNVEPGRDMAPDGGSSLMYAERFTLEDNETYTLLRVINPWQGEGDIVKKYWLIERDVDADSLNVPDDVTVVRTPVDRVVCMSVTHVAMLDAIDKGSAIIGVSGGKMVYNRDLRERIERGEVREVGYEESLNRELIASMDADLLIAYGIGGESAGYFARLSEMGVNILYNAEYLERSPLGKAEWIKLFGALTGEREKSDSIFTEVREEYYRNMRLYRNEVVSDIPSVLLGLPWRDTWYVSPGNSFISNIIDDAGGNYLWRDRESGYSMPMGIESVYMRALEADYWINPGAAESLREIALSDERLTTLDVYKRGEVYNNTKRVREGGANDYWETGSVRPGLLLRDIALIISGRGEEADLYFYKRLE